jgi:hypothetical protein
MWPEDQEAHQVPLLSQAPAAKRVAEWKAAEH